MSDAARKGIVVPLSRTDEGGLRGVLVEDEGKRTSLCEFRDLEEGRPILGGHLAQLKPREGSLLLDAEITEIPSVPDTRGGEREPPTAEERPSIRHAGPSRVSSDAYRNGWERIWGRNGGKPGEA